MGSQRKINTTKTNKEEEEEEDHCASNKIKSQPPSKEEEEDHVGQGELYTPAHAVNNDKEQQQRQQEKINNTNYVTSSSTELNETVAGTGAGGGGGGGGGVNMRAVEEIARHFGVAKYGVLEKKLAAAAAVNKSSIQAEALGNARHFLETLVKDVRAAAHGLTKDALKLIKTHLLHTLPYLSPAIATKMVDDEANKAGGEGEGEEEGEEEQDKGKQRRQPRVSPISSLFSSLTPSARL